jgi:quercetin dioxygenase-like cupin family protein
MITNMSVLLKNYKPYSIDISAWNSEIFPTPSNELSVVYVQHYNGPHTKQVQSTHDSWEIGCILSGKAELHLDETHQLKQGDVFLLAPDTVSL